MQSDPDLSTIYVPNRAVVDDHGVEWLDDHYEDADDVESLHERIKVAEREMLVENVGRMAREGITVTGRRVRFGRA